MVNWRHITSLFLLRRRAMEAVFELDPRENRRKIYKPGCLPGLIETPASSKVSTSLKTRTAPCITPIARAVPVRFPKTHPQVEYGLEPKVLKHSATSSSCEQCPAKRGISRR